MDFESTVTAIVVGVLIAKFVGFIGNRMYEVLLMMAEDNAGLIIIAIGGLGWLAVILGGGYVYKLWHTP